MSHNEDSSHKFKFVENLNLTLNFFYLFQYFNFIRKIKSTQFLSFLRQLLQVHNAKYADRVTGFTQLHVLSICFSEKVTGFTQLHILNICFSERVTDFTQLHVLSICFSEGVTNFTQLHVLNICFSLFTDISNE